MIETSMVSINSSAAASPTRMRGAPESATAPSVLNTAAMWLAGTRSPTRGNGGDHLNASEVLDSATKWLASEGVTNPVFTESPKPKRPSSPMRTRHTYDAPPAPISSLKWRPKERTRSGSGRGLTSERRRHPHPLASNPENELPRTKVPPSPERPRTSRITAEQHPSTTSNNTILNESQRTSKRKRGRDSSSSNLIDGVEGLGQRLKRVCLKAKFHRRTRRHVSDEDLTKIGTTPILPPKPETPAPVTPPDVKREAIDYSRPYPLTKKASSRSLGTGISALGREQEHVAFVSSELPASNAFSLVTGVVDSQMKRVQTQTPSDDDRKKKAAAPMDVFGLQPQQTKSVFLQQRDSGKNVMLEESDLSDQEIIFTASTTSDEEFAT